MELPSERGDRERLYRNIVRQAEYGKAERRERFRSRKLLYLTGTPNGNRAYFNSLKEWAKLSSSLIYAPENTQFGVTVPPYYGDRWDEELQIAREELRRLWFDGPSPAVIHRGVMQAHYADTAIAKLFVSQNHVDLDMIPDPSDLGVEDEHKPFNRQEFYVHWYTLSLAAFWRLIQGIPDAERRERLWTAAEADAKPSTEARGDILPPALHQTIILAQASPTMEGHVAASMDLAMGMPRSRTRVVKLAELWIWDDRAAEVCAQCRQKRVHWRHKWSEEGGGHAFEAGDPPQYAPDWRVATNLLSLEEILWDPVNPLGIEGHPFFPLSLGPLDGHVWGVAPMEDMIGLQVWGEKKLGELDTRDELQLNPPLALRGVAFSDGERTKAYRRPGGDIPMQMGGEVTPIVPAPLADPFEFYDKIAGMRRSMAGIPNAMAGQTDPGVRSGEQAIALALLGAGPTMSNAMIVEAWIGDIATAMLRIHRNILGRPLVKNDRTEFLLRQVPEDFVARVWAHSASPIYTESLIEKATIAHTKGAISDEAYLQYLNLPNTDVLLRESKKLQAAKAEQAKKVIDLKDAETSAKVETARAKMVQARTP